MTDEQIITAVDEALAKEFELDPDMMKPEARFKEDLGLDSLDAVDMVIVLEKTFQVKIGKDPAILSIRTVGDMHSYIIAKKHNLNNA